MRDNPQTLTFSSTAITSRGSNNAAMALSSLRLLCIAVFVAMTDCVYCLSAKSQTCSEGTDSLYIYRKFPKSTVSTATQTSVTTPISDGTNQTELVNQAYQAALRAWREENLGLPLYFLPPIVLDRGDKDTGVGLRLMRIPPFGLIESIVDYNEINDADEKSQTMIYKVLNPSWLTWPVSYHRGEIEVKMDDIKSQCELHWRVEWTPYSLGSFVDPAFHGFVKKVTTFIITTAADHVVRER
jgi:hypothetical protein